MKCWSRCAQPSGHECDSQARVDNSATTPLREEQMINFIFRQCVRLLEWAARKLGTTYNAINVWIFCVIWPAITIGLIIAVIVLWRKVAVLQHP